MDIGAGVIGGVRKAVSDDNETVSVERIPRAFLMGKIGQGPKIADTAQKELQTSNLLRVAYNETLFFAFMSNGALSGVSQKYLWFFKKDGKVDSSIKLKKIKSVEADGSTVVVESSGMKKLKLTCESEEAAKEAAKIITLRVMLFF